MFVRRSTTASITLGPRYMWSTKWRFPTSQSRTKLCQETHYALVLLNYSLHSIPQAPEIISTLDFKLARWHKSGLQILQSAVSTPRERKRRVPYHPIHHVFPPVNSSPRSYLSIPYRQENFPDSQPQLKPTSITLPSSTDGAIELASLKLLCINQLHVHGRPPRRG